MTEHDQGVMQKSNNAQRWLQAHPKLCNNRLLSHKERGSRLRSVRAMLAWFSTLFMRDVRAFEFFSGCMILGWAYISDIVTDRNSVTSSMDGASTLINPNNLVWAGYVLGCLQLIALMTLQRVIRAPVAIATSVFMGLLTIGVWMGPLAPALSLYVAFWVANGYIFVRLCRPRP